MKKIVAVLVIFLFFYSTQSGLTRLIKLNDNQLCEIKANAGISIELNNVKLYHEFQEISFHDSKGGLSGSNKLDFQDIVIGNGTGWAYYINTSHPIEIDIVEFSQGWWDIDPDYALQINTPNIYSNKIISIGNIKFCGQDIGSLKLGPYLQNAFKFWLAPPDCNTPLKSDAGLYFKLWTNSKQGGLKYIYNNNGYNFQAKNITISQSFEGSPENPSYWIPHGNFLVGKEGGADGDFARINITKSQDKVILDMDFPMSGSIRISNIHGRDMDFGPIAIDGITVNRMSVKFIP